LEVLDVEKRHNIIEKGKGEIFFRARAINNCNEPGDWSDPLWFSPSIAKLFNKKVVIEKTLYNRNSTIKKPLSKAQCLIEVKKLAKKALTQKALMQKVLLAEKLLLAK